MHVHKTMTDLKFNVAQLLRDEVGARREYTFDEKAVPLDEDSTLLTLQGQVRFTRTPSGVLVDVYNATAEVEMPCIRCLTPSIQHISLQFRDEFHAQVEVTTGYHLPQPDEDDPFFITENHLVDLGEAIRGYALLELPMQPLCKPDCLGLCSTCGADLNNETCTCDDTESDERFAALKALLKDK